MDEYREALTGPALAAALGPAPHDHAFGRERQSQAAAWLRAGV